MLSINKLQSGYGKKHIIHDVTMRIDSGEVISLLGRNGMGKTTSLRTIMGLTPAWDGSIEFDGRSIKNASPNAISRYGIGYVPEGRGIFPNLTVREISSWRRGQGAGHSIACMGCSRACASERQIGDINFPAGNSRCCRSAARSCSIRR